MSAQTKLINPHLPNTFLDSYILPDSTVRFIGSEYGSARELFYVDRLKDGTITEPVFFPESIGGLEFNFAGVDCKILKLIPCSLPTPRGLPHLLSYVLPKARLNREMF